MADHEREETRGSLALRPLLLALGAYHLLLGAFMAVAPRTFYDELAGYPPYNDHFIRDISSFTLALGVMFVIAAARKAWQVPVLFLALTHYVLHVLNHVWDVADTEPDWMGPVNLIALAVVTGAIYWLLRKANR